MEAHSALGIVDVVSEIIQRIGCSRSVHRSTAVNRTFLSAARADDFSKAYIGRNCPAFIGFVVEFVKNSGAVQFRLISNGEVAAADDTVAALTAFIDPSNFSEDYVIGCSGGFVLSLCVGSTEMEDGYYTWRPGYPTKIFVSPRIPKIPHSHVNHLGQFGVILEAGSSGIAFYV